MNIKKFVKFCEKNNHTFLLESTYCWGLKLKHIHDGEYTFYKTDGKLKPLLKKGIKYINERDLNPLLDEVRRKL
jgi:hypothetical protein